MQRTNDDFLIARQEFLARMAEEKPRAKPSFWRRPLVKIILVDLAGLAFFAALVMFPNAIAGITIVGLALGFILMMVNIVASGWTWKDTAIVASPLIFSALRKASHD